MSKKIGIIGGLGPMATAKFVEILNENITDYDSIEYLVINDPTTPDRTKYILDHKNESPVPSILNMVDKLNKYKVDLIVMPCNTASYFYDQILKHTKINFINIVEETVLYAKKNNIDKIGLLATRGSIKGGVYRHYCELYDIDYIIPNEEEQDVISSIIYDGIKAGQDYNADELYNVSNSLIKKGAQKIILGCTELSVIYQDKKIVGDEFIDSMQVLGKRIVEKVNELE